MRKIEQKLKNMAKKQALTKTEKNALWSKIEAGINKINVSVFPVFQPRFAFAFLATIAIIGTSAATVAASNDAGPGDLLYPIDLAVERIQLALSKEENKDNLRLVFAQERLREAQRALAFEDRGLDNGPTATSTPEEFKRIKKADKALPEVLEKLEETKDLLEEKGNGEAAEHIDEIIDRLTLLAQNHMSDLDDFEKRMKDDDKERQEVKVYREKIKNKFSVHLKERNEDDDDDELEKEDRKIIICHFPSGDSDKARTIEIAVPALEAHLIKGDHLGPCGDDDGNATSTPDVIAPIISDVNASASTNTAEITWNTNEESDSRLWYATSTPVNVSSANLSVYSGDLTLEHSLSLTDLNASSTYYFVIGSADESGNQATSSESSFATL